MRQRDPPNALLAELDAAQEWIFTYKPTPDEVWLHLERRDVTVDRSLVRPLLAVWLESKREVDGYDRHILPGYGS